MVECRSIFNGKRTLGRDHHAFALPKEEGVDFSGVAGQQQIAILTKVLDDHCQLHRIAGKAGRDAVALLLMMHYVNGLTTIAALKSALDKAIEE
jgi:hypothetical protein